MISVVIPLYNKEKQIANTLRSVFAQTYTDYEIIVVNDGSTDNSVAAVKSLNDPRIRLIHQKNAGVSAARNRGIEEARGEYIALLDGDDQWKPKFLETIANLITKYPECDVFATNYEFIDHKGNVKPTIINNIPFKESDGILTNYFRVAATSHPPICASSIAINTNILRTIAGFPIGIKSGEDLLTWARLASLYKIAYTKLNLASFIDSSNAEQSKTTNRIGGEKYVADKLIEIYKDNNRLDGLKLYIARWFKSWGIILIEAEKNHSAFKVALEGIKWGGKYKHFIPIIILSIFPSKIAKFLFYRLKK